MRITYLHIMLVTNSIIEVGIEYMSKESPRIFNYWCKIYTVNIGIKINNQTTVITYTHYLRHLSVVINYHHTALLFFFFRISM